MITVGTYDSFREGDVALIMKDVPIITPHTSIVPICLPNPDIFKNKNVPEARPALIVGWGHQRYVFDTGQELFESKHSCNTNGARTTSVGTAEDAVQGIFAPCKRYSKNPISRYCYDNQFTGLVSASQDIQFWFTGQIQNRIPNLRRHSNDQICNKYLVPAKTKFDNYYSSNLPSPAFEKNVARVKLMLTGKDGKTRSIKCFNLLNVAMQGICETKDFSWGFCSEACRAPEGIIYDEKYRKVPVFYHDKLPEGVYRDTGKGTNKTANKIRDKIREKFHQVYKCFWSKPPLLNTAEFEVDENQEDPVTYRGTIVKDTPSSNEETGYRSPYYGDSGSPIFITTDEINKGDRHVMLASYSGFAFDPYRETYQVDSTTVKAANKCRNLATKINDSILKWITKLALSS